MSDYQMPRIPGIEDVMSEEAYTVLSLIPIWTFFPALMDEIQEDVQWRGPDPALYVWAMLTDAELAHADLDIAWGSFTAASSRLSLAYSFVFTRPIGRILSGCGEKSASEVIASILGDRQYPPRPLKRFEAECCVEGLNATGNHFEAGERCAICDKDCCQDAPPNSDHVCRKTECGHVFGHDCLVKHLVEKDDRCPVYQFTLAIYTLE